MDSENWPSLIFSVHIQDINVHIPAKFQTSIFDVWNNMGRENCPYSGHQVLMSGTWTVEKKRCPDKNSDVRNMDNDVWNMESDVQNMDSDVPIMDKKY